MDSYDRGVVDPDPCFDVLAILTVGLSTYATEVDGRRGDPLVAQFCILG